MEKGGGAGKQKRVKWGGGLRINSRNQANVGLISKFSIYFKSVSNNLNFP